MTDVLEFADYLRFLSMDEQSVKEAFKQWLLQLSIEKGWLNSEGQPVHARIAEHFGISRQVVGNWMDGTSFLSTQMVNGNICPRMGISPSEFWEQMQAIDRELKGIVLISKQMDEARVPVPSTARDLLYYLRGLSTEEQVAFQQAFFRTLAGIKDPIV